MVILSVNQTKRGNMRNFIFITFIILLVTGCADKKMEVKEGSKLSDQPEWAMNMGKYDKGIGAVGVARPTKLGTQRQINQANLAARMQLAQILESKIEGAVESAAESAIMLNLPEGKEIGQLTEQEQVRTFVKKTLEMSQPNAQWKDPENGELYVWMILEQRELDILRGNLSRKALKKTLNDTDETHQKKMKLLDEKIDKKFKE